MQQAVTQAIAGLSERKVQFTYTDVLARTVGILPPENGVIERARAGRPGDGAESQPDPAGCAG